ncbi:HAMP domain-containing histidine kinase [Amylibacter sp. SFDW26]|uniref:sensor histidine kinase n=1 Tax=Amylibacter sp. SFDW26 TaxID=2652722 RepID=UPI0012619AA3|nr:HAMP domain-containing sensor histidine kinase [Amylibacter sp. SFDW26]KAB7614384.1 HAMP domain-containing histidine kinase [Amylibacter sp. SFDW26]
MKIQTRLILPITLILSVTWIGGAVFTKKAAFKKSREFLVEQTKTVADSWMTVVKGVALEPTHLAGRENEILAAWVHEELIFSKGQMVLGKPHENADFIQKINGDNWVFSSRCAQEICLIVGTRDTDRKFAVRWLLVSIYIPLFFIFLIGLVAAIAAVRSALKPLNILAGQVGDADLDKLEKLPAQNVDEELKPLVAAINTLIENLKTQLEKERGFLNTYAHEIRTPIAGLISQMQSLENIDAETQAKLDNVRSCADRTVRVANQFLALAKSKNTAALKGSEDRFDLCEVIRQTAAEVVGAHPEIDLQMVGDASIVISADMFAIEVIVRNLLDNAKWYGKPKAEKQQSILISCVRDQEQVFLSIEDNGAGLTDSQIQQVTHEFYRAETIQNAPVNPDGAGLGLSIVQAMVGLYDGQIGFERSEKLGGLKVRLALPLN